MAEAAETVAAAVEETTLALDENADAAARLKAQYESSAAAAAKLTIESDGLLDRFQAKLPEAVDRLRDGMSDVFSDAILDAHTLSETLKNLGDLFARVAIQTAVARAVGGAFNAAGLFGTSGGTVDVNHAGGVVGQTASRMTFPAMGPRLHGGLERDEFPAILQRGETVTPAGAEPKAIVNVSSPDMPIEAEVTSVRSTFDAMVIDVLIRGRRRRDPRMAGF